MAELFISYSSTDSLIAKDIVESIENTGIICWISQRDIPPGADFAVEIPKAITACNYFILLLTNAAQESPYVMLELDNAFRQKKEIIPVLLEPVTENEKTNFFLNAKQKLDATNNPSMAVKTIINTVRSSSTKPADVLDQLSKCNVRRTAYTLCPCCGNELLKDDPKTQIGLRMYIENERIVRKFRSHISLEHAQTAGLYTSFVIIALLLIHCCLIEVSPFLLLSILLTSLSTLFLYLDEKREAKNLKRIQEHNKTITATIDKIIQIINDSRLKCWQLKCERCKRKYIILLPEVKSI